MQIKYSIKSIRTVRTVEFIIDDSDPDIISIKMGSTCLQVLASEVGSMFCDIDSFLAKSIERSRKE